MRGYLSRLIFLLIALAAPVASAAMVEFGDGDFAPGPAVCNESLGAAGSGSEIAGYELVKDVRGAGEDGFTCFRQEPSGGNPGAWAASTVGTANVQTIACMLKDDAIYDPALSGGFAYVDFTEDGICPGGGVQCVSSGVCVRQAGHLYIARTDFVPETVWTPKAAFGLSPADFSWLSGPGPSVVLDFGPTGAPLQFGFYRARSGSPAVTGTDNWRVVTQDACIDDAACNDANGCTVESCVAGVCERAPLDCDDADGCTNDVCVDGQCTHPPVTCDDGSNCTIDSCAFDQCQYLPSADFGTVSEEIDALLAILEGPACGEEILKRSFLKKFTKKLKKARGKTNRADQIEDLLKLPGLKEKAAALLEKARFFLAGQVEKGTISAECGQALTDFVYRIDGCLAFVPVG